MTNHIDMGALAVKILLKNNNKGLQKALNLLSQVQKRGSIYKAMYFPV